MLAEHLSDAPIGDDDKDEAKTFRLGGQRLSVLANGKSDPAYQESGPCLKVAQCPCEAPCTYYLRALDDLQRGGWPASVQRRPALRRIYKQR